MKKLVAFLFAPFVAVVIALVLFVAVFVIQALLYVTIVNPLQLNPHGYTIITAPSTFGMLALVFDSAFAMISFWLVMLLMRVEPLDLRGYSGIFTAGISALAIPLIGEQHPEHYRLLVLLMDLFIICLLISLTKRTVGGSREVVDDAKLPRQTGNVSYRRID